MSLPLQSPCPPQAVLFAAGDSARVRLELWRSLISIFRGYTFDPNFAENPVTVAEFSPAEAVARCGNTELTLSLNLATGLGDWNLNPGLASAEAAPGDQGSFELQEAGTVIWQREEKEFDHAAIEWVELLIRRSKEIRESETP